MLLGKIQTDQLSALKARDQEKLNILRYILAQINYKKIDKKSDLTDDEIVQVLRKVQKELDEKIIGLNKTVFDTNKKAIIGIVMKELRTKASSQRIIQILQKEYLK